MMSGSLDLTLIEHARCTKHLRKNGNEALFFKFVLIPTPGSEKGDFIIKQSITAEERQAGKEMPILGDVTDWSNAEGANERPARRAQRPARKDLFR